ncbi:5'-nucleotidase [Aurantibacter sp.]|uniref:5'-nucleotidase n=1 Tax=Aurantibacter sp. TaxID=2807103 RepID=UPI0032678039
MQFSYEDKQSTFFKIKQIVVFVTICLATSCSPNKTSLNTVAGKEITIDSSFTIDVEIESFIKPYYNRINSVLDSTLSYTPKMLSKGDGRYNSSLGNLMAEILLEQSNPIFTSRTGKTVDFALFNHGGIRSIISKGNISARTAYEVMPFENAIIIVELSGKSIQKLVQYVIDYDSPHPVAGIQITINKNNTPKEIKIQGTPLDPNRNYFVATSSYLVTGGDNMVFFKDGLSFTDIDYSIRNSMIDYFKKIDTIKTTVDNRVIKL